jgi:hypothetical protein
MKKSFKVVGVTLALGGIFAIGSAVGATSDWKNEVVIEASRQIGGAGFEKKEEILTNADIGSQMKQVLQPTIQQQEDELARLLEEYYNMKLQGLQDTPEFKEIEQQIEQIKVNVYERYRKEIDDAFEGV